MTFLEMVTVLLPLAKLLLGLYCTWYPLPLAFLPHLTVIFLEALFFKEEMAGLATR